MNNTLKKYNITEEVLDRAVEAAREADGSILPKIREILEAQIRAVYPILTEAAFAAGFEEARKKVEDAAERYDSQRDRANWNDPFREGKMAGFRASLAALTDTEGRGPGSIEGRQEPPAATTDSVVNTNPEGGEN